MQAILTLMPLIQGSRSGENLQIENFSLGSWLVKNHFPKAPNFYF